MRAPDNKKETTISTKRPGDGPLFFAAPYFFFWSPVPFYPLRFVAERKIRAGFPMEIHDREQAP